MGIEWPETSQIAPYRPPSTVQQIETLFYHVGLTVSAVYVITNVVLSRLLSKTYDQRLDLSHSTLLRLRRLVNSLRSKVKTTSVTALGENRRLVAETKVYVDRCQQTGERLEELERHSTFESVNDRLEDLNLTLKNYNKEVGNVNDFESVSFKTKLFVDLLRDKSWRSKMEESNRELIRSMREMKGWFIHGRIPNYQT